MKFALAIFVCCLMGTQVRAQQVSFMRDIAPILVQRCTACHGERKDAGDYRAHTFDALMHPNSDEAPIVPGKPEASLLFQLISSPSAKKRMPQKDDALSPAQIELFKNWIAQGAKFDGADKAVSIKTLMGPRQHPNPPEVYRLPVPVMAMAFAPGGKSLAVAGYHEVTLWDPASGKLQSRIQRLPERIQSISYSSDGQLLVAGGTPGDYGELALVDPAGAKPPTVLDTFEDICLAAAFSGDGKLIAAGGADQTLRIYDRATGKVRWAAKHHSDWITAVGFSADMRYVASASRDMTVKIYELATGHLFTTYAGHNRQIGAYKGSAPVYDIRFAEDSPLIYSAGGGTWIQIWDPDKAKAENGTAADLEERFAKNGHTKYIPHAFGREIYRMALRPGKLFAAAGDGGVKQFDPATLKERLAYPGLTDFAFSIDCDIASNRLAAGSADGQIKVWEIDTAKPVTTFYAAPGFAPAK